MRCSKLVLGAAMLSLPGIAVAQTVTTPLPPVPAMEPLYPVHSARRPLETRTVTASYAAPVMSRPAAIVRPSLALPGVAVRPALPEHAPPMLLPTNTDVLVRLHETVSSKGHKVGDTFRLTVVQDVMMGGSVVIPRGTPAVGRIAWRTGKGMFGKSAKMEITIDQLQLNGHAVPLTGRFRAEGDGNTGATIGTAVAAGLIAAAFVTGHSAVFESGREFRVSTREAVAFTPLQAPFRPVQQVAEAATSDR